MNEQSKQGAIDQSTIGSMTSPSYDEALSSKPGLLQAISGAPYSTSLELCCGDITTYRILANQTHGKYFGFSFQESVAKRMEEYYQQNRSSLRLTPSKFMRYDVFDLADKGIFFDLICINSLQYHFTIGTEEDLRKLLVKLLRHTRRLVFHVLLSESLGEMGAISVHTRTRLRVLDGIPYHSFFSLLHYQGVATLCKRRVHLVRGERFEYAGVHLETSYLVFE